MFATPDALTTFRLPNRLVSLLAVSDRFHLKPMLRSVTFPQVAFVLALAQNSVRLLEVVVDLEPAEVAVPGPPASVADLPIPGSIDEATGALTLSAADDAASYGVVDEIARRVWLSGGRVLAARLGGPSLPLDIGFSETVPAGIRNAVTLRDQHCRWAGGCNQPARACQVHHVRHKANGGKTSVRDCVLLCPFHHQVVIHRWGWTLVLNPDGTTTAWNPDKTRVLHSHSPPANTG